MLCGCIVTSGIMSENGLADITLLSTTSCSALWIFFTLFGRIKSYRPNSPIHTLLCADSSIFFYTFLFLLCPQLWILCAPLGLQNLTPGTKRCSMICASLRLFLPFYIFLFLLCSWLWVLFALRASKSYARNSPIHTLSCVAMLL